MIFFSRGRDSGENLARNSGVFLAGVRIGRESGEKIGCVFHGGEDRARKSRVFLAWVKIGRGSGEKFRKVRVHVSHVRVCNCQSSRSFESH